MKVQLGENTKGIAKPSFFKEINVDMKKLDAIDQDNGKISLKAFQ